MTVVLKEHYGVPVHLTVQTCDTANNSYRRRITLTAGPTGPRMDFEFLNDMDLGRIRAGRIAEVDDPDPSAWGDLVLTREAGGDIVFIDPQLYWESLFTLFRARGTDPHYWRRR